MFLRFDGGLSNNNFISIVILSYTRPDHLKNLLESIHLWADMPFEIIVSDDGSHINDTRSRIMSEMESLISTTVFNIGANMGLAASANRGVALANSDYVLVMNDDTLVTGPAFRNIKDALSVPYVGVFGPWFNRFIDSNRPEEELVHVNSGGTDLYLTSLPSGSSIFAFRKKVWQEIGGFPQVYHCGGDIAFIHAVCGAGYFNAQVPRSQPESFVNVDVSAGYVDETFARSPFDSSYPHIFGVPNLREENLGRAQRIHNFSQVEYEKDLGLHNTESWRSYFKDARKGETYDWSKLQKLGHNRWQKVINKEIKNEDDSQRN